MFHFLNYFSLLTLLSLHIVQDDSSIICDKISIMQVICEKNLYTLLQCIGVTWRTRCFESSLSDENLHNFVLL